MQRAPNDGYVLAEKFRALIWNRCLLCGVYFKFEKGVRVFTHLCLLHPSLRENGLAHAFKILSHLAETMTETIVIFKHPERQSLCLGCSDRLFDGKDCLEDVEFYSRLEKIHRASAPLRSSLPVYRGKIERREG